VQVRCIGGGHSWNRLVATEGMLLDLRRIRHVKLEGRHRVRVGGGCTLGRLLDALRPHGLTLPTLGVITKQSVAGAIATGTHGSGAASLSHFVEEVTIAGLDGLTTLRVGDELLAARCALGALGPVVEVVLGVRDAYRIEEHFEKTDHLPRFTGEWPLQQFALFPWSWIFAVYRRREASGGSTLKAMLMRFWLFAYVDLGLHAAVWVLARMRRWTRGFHAGVLPALIFSHRRIDDSRAVLTLQHQLFRHVEMELFVPEPRLEAAIATLIDAVHGAAQRGWIHHYPIFFRKVLPEETLVSMASPAHDYAGPWISIGIFSYRGVDGAFESFATSLASRMAAEHGARLHWGKYLPLSFATARSAYPRFAEFEAICRRQAPASWNEAV
jgi:FAD/FMN-containing dehydrogenase